MKLVKLNTSNSEQGFTIVELMIATAVLSTILVMVTVMITSIGNLYYKGVTQSQTQNTLRNIADAVAQDIKLTKGTPSVGSGSATATNGRSYPVVARCIGTTRYTWVVGIKLGSDIQHVLWRDKINSGAACDPVNLTATTPSNGSELLSQNTRLTHLDFSPGSNPAFYKIQVSVAYGDYDLLQHGSGQPYENPATVTDLHLLDDNTVHCASGVGSQFCATDSLTTGALQRIN